MQGGRSESSVLGRWEWVMGTKLKADDESSGYESELEVSDSLSLGEKLDTLVHTLRTVFAVLISLPVSWICMHPSIGAFRLHKFEMVRSGTATVLALQSKLRHPVLDVYFGILSFCAEEEFYLLVLPYLIWNVDRILGCRLTVIVSVGLFAGNTLKDIFGLPRPPHPPVWRPAHQEAIDSTNLQDFGFPSTHSMNAVTNSLVVLLYYCNSISHESIVGLVAVCIWYIGSMCISRMYLGAHSPTDIRGGLALGFLLVAVYAPNIERVEVFYNETPMIFPKVFCLTFFLLLMCPQPRPPTPTFNQNALLLGLVGGLIFGSRQFHALTLAEAIEWRSYLRLGDASEFATSHFYLNTVVKTVSGYSIVMIFRVIAKTAIVALLNVFGVSTKPRVVDESTRTTRRSKIKVVRLLTRDVDILGTAIVKVFTYMTLAWAITFFVPFVHIILGLSSI